MGKEESWLVKVSMEMLKKERELWRNKIYFKVKDALLHSRKILKKITIFQSCSFTHVAGWTPLNFNKIQGGIIGKERRY